MQFGCGRVGKHFETVKLLVYVLFIESIKFFFFPFLLPFGFDGFHIHRKLLLAGEFRYKNIYVLYSNINRIFFPLF